MTHDTISLLGLSYIDIHECLLYPIELHQLPWSTSDHIAHYVFQRHIKDNQKVHPWRVQSYQPCLPPMQIGFASIQHGDQSYYRIGSIHNERVYIIVPSPFLPFFGFARIHLWSSIENNDKHNQAGGKYHIHSKVLQCPCYHTYPNINILPISLLEVDLRLTTGAGASCDGGAAVSGASRRVQCLLFSSPFTRRCACIDKYHLEPWPSSKRKLPVIKEYQWTVEP